jgi:hypothetical protein
LISVDNALNNLSELLFSLRSPVAYISGATEVGTVAAPVMADFSSPGPNFITPEILKVLLIDSHERFKIHAQYYFYSESACDDFSPTSLHLESIF